jgi:type IV pilus assembly protein PilY1
MVPVVPPITGIGAPGKPGTNWTNGLGGPVIVVPPQVPTVFVPPTTPISCVAWPCVTSDNTQSGGSVNSLADVAQYYYVTDLRPTLLNEVPISNATPIAEADRANWQHMTTFVIGLGVSGILQFDKNYKSVPSSSADFAEVRIGSKSWPIPAADQPTSIDDFWHTAVNGRGRYVAAGNPQDVAEAVATILADISASAGAGAAAASPSPATSPGPGSGVYASSYTPKLWSGDLRYQAEVVVAPATTPQVYWSASQQMATTLGTGCDNRNIFLFRAGAPDNLANFSWNSFRCAGGVPTGTADTGLTASERTLITAGVPSLSHYAQMTDGSGGTVNQRSLASGSNLINFLRGQRTLEDFKPNIASQLFRLRGGPIGDIVNSAASFLKRSVTTYSDPGYTAFAASNETRRGMVYVGSNDGMLHAFYAGESTTDADGGREAWAYVPAPVLPDLYRLADKNYGTNHRFFVDGQVIPYDVYDSVAGQWKTIIVGSLAAGGKGYYAVDVTNPLSPKGLWEFNHSATCYDPTTTATAAATNSADCYLGLTYGKPQVGKLADGSWVVVVTSGINNINSPTKPGDGKGYLYVLDAITGKIKFRMQTPAGSATDPSGLTQIALFADDPSVNATIRQGYGVDILGNIWRFDLNDRPGVGVSGRDVVLLGTAKDANGVPQPITTRPILTAPDLKPVITVATGRYLGISDQSNDQAQSVYSIVDPLSDASPVLYSDLRAVLTRRQIVRSASNTITQTCAGGVPTCSTSGQGWIIDFPASTGAPSERVVIDPVLRAGAFGVATNLPTGTPCNAGGVSFVYAINGAGSDEAGTLIASTFVNNPVVGLVPRGPSPGGPGSPQCKIQYTDSKGNLGCFDYQQPPLPPKSKRVSWRELAE